MQTTPKHLQATVFGSTGFLGRPTVNQLGRMGSQVVVPYRGDEHDTRHLRVMGDYGQIVMVPFGLKDEASIKNTVQVHPHIHQHQPHRTYFLFRCA